MRFTPTLIMLLITQLFLSGPLVVVAQDRGSQVSTDTNTAKPKNPTPMSTGLRRPLQSKLRTLRPVIPPVTVLNNPEYLSGEASISVAANSNPLIRIGIAQNGVTLIEFPSADRFFAIHAGNSDLVTIEKSPSLKRDHHLVLRAGTGFVVPNLRSKQTQSIPGTSIIAQMDSGMAITLMIYPVPLLKQQAHRLVIKYDREQVIAARRAVGLATNLVEAAVSPEATVQTASVQESEADASSALQTGPSEPAKAPAQPEILDYKSAVETALNAVMSNPKRFKKWSQQRHGLQISTLLPTELSETARLVVFAVRNTGGQSLRLISGYPDLYVERLNDQQRPVEAGTKVQKLCVASSTNDTLVAPGATKYFALAYEAPILGVQQHLKIVVAHMNAADEPAMADVTALAK